jgi:hypothetical protein
MAVRSQLLCFLLRLTAVEMLRISISKTMAYAGFCVRVQLAAKGQKSDSKSADPCGREGSTPSPGTNRTKSLDRISLL